MDLARHSPGRVGPGAAVRGISLVLALLLPIPALAADALAADAPGFTVRGRVVDRETGLPVAGVEITTEAGEVFTTDTAGRFEVTSPRPGLLTLSLHRDGYQPLRRELRGLAGQEMAVTIELRPLPTVREELTVVGRLTPAVEPVRRVEPEEVITVPGAGEDVLRTLMAMPGVTGSDDWNTGLFVRGGRPDQNGIYLDGIPIYDPYRLFGLTSLFNPETLESITLYPGGFDVRYGDRLSSVIAVENRTGDPDRRFAGSANVNLTNTNLTAEGGFGRSFPASWLLTFRRTYYDLLLDAMGETDSQYPSFTDVQARFLWQPAPDHRFTLTTLGSDEGTDLQEDFEESFGEADSRVEFVDDQKHLVAGLRGDHRFGSRLSLRYVLSWTHNQQVSDLFYRQGETAYETRLDQDLASEVLSLRPLVEVYLGAHTLLAGTEAARSDNRVAFHIRTEDPRILIPEELLDFALEQDFRKYGGFLQDTWQATPNLELKAGLRWDRSTLSERRVAGPRAALRWRPRPHWELGAAWGYYYQFPSYESLQGDGYFLDLRGIKQLRLKPERAVHSMLSGSYRSAAGWTLTLDLYHKDLDDVLQSGEDREEILVLDDQDQAHPYVRDEYNLVPENTRWGHARGADLTFTLPRRPERRLIGMLSYTYGQVKTRDEDGWRWAAWDRRHTVTWIGGWRIGRFWEVGWRWRWGTGFPYTPVTNVIRVVNDLDGDGRYEPEEGEDYTYQRDDPDEVEHSQRFPDYHRLDLRCQYARRFGKVDTAFYLDLINVYDRLNVFVYDYNEDFSEREENEGGGMPFLPSFGVKVRF